MELYLAFGDGSPKKWVRECLFTSRGGVSGNLKPLWNDFLAERSAMEIYLVNPSCRPYVLGGAIR